MLDTILGIIQKIAPYWPWIESLLLSVGGSWILLASEKWVWKAVKSYKDIVLTAKQTELQGYTYIFVAWLQCLILFIVTWPSEFSFYWGFFVAGLSPGIYRVVVPWVCDTYPRLRPLFSSSTSKEMQTKIDPATGHIGVKVGKDDTQYIDPKTGKFRE